MNKIHTLFGAALVCIVSLAGCETGGVSSRIQEKATVFGNLTADQQAVIKAGGVEYGFTPDMVYMALGKATKVDQTDTPQGKVEKWTYGKYFGPRPEQYGAVRAERAADGRYTPWTNTTNAPSLGNGKGQGDGGSSSSNPGGPQTMLTVADLEPTTLIIFFLEGAVYDMKIKERS